MAPCPLCKSRTRTIIVRDDLAKGQDHYPFQHLDVHGDPPHALMLFLDSNLSVRDVMAYKDISFAKSQKEKFTNRSGMSEDEILASIYMEPLRIKILRLLTRSSVSEERLIDYLSKENGFKAHQLNQLMFPFISGGLIRTNWHGVSRYQWYFLIKDFIALRTVPITTEWAFKNKPEFKPAAKEYFAKRKEVFYDYKKRLNASSDSRLDEIRLCLKILTDTKHSKIIYRLRPRPLEENVLLQSVSSRDLLSLTVYGVIWDFEVESKKYYALLSDIKTAKFPPEYLLDKIPEQVKNHELPMEIAQMHLDFLYNAEENKV